MILSEVHSGKVIKFTNGGILNEESYSNMSS